MAVDDISSPVDTTLASASANTAYAGAQASSVQAQAAGLYHKGMTHAQMQKTADDFESMFLSEMLKPMFDGIQADPMFGGGEGENQWQSLMLDQYGKTMVAHGGVGIAKQVMKVMLQAQAAAEGTAPEPATPAQTKTQYSAYSQASSPSKSTVQETLQ